MQGNAQLTWQVVKYPDVVVTGEPMYLYTAVAQFGQFAQESYVSTWYNMSILKPIVENIAQKDEAFGIVFDGKKVRYCRYL